MESTVFVTVFGIVVIVAIVLMVIQGIRAASYNERTMTDHMRRDGLKPVDLPNAPKGYKLPPRIPRAQPVDLSGYKEMSLYSEKVVGVTRRNDDGGSRQEVIKYLDEGDSVELVREPDNPNDPNAIGVWDGGDQIGYIDAFRAEELAPQMDKGYPVEAWVKKILGGRDGKSYGIVIKIQRYKPIRN